MSWLEITIDTASQGIEEVAAALTAGGFSDLLLEDQAEFTAFLDENRAYWDYIDEKLEQSLQGLSHIKLYLENTDTTGLSRLEQLLEKLKAGDPEHNLGSLSMKISQLQDTDWEESWKENYPPQEIGQRLVVLPYWLADQKTDRLPVILDPGLTFGTGAHPSTQMVIRAMEQRVQPGCSCIDLGSGSGILSIAALRLGAKSAVGVDIDPKAEDIARQNAAYNGYAAPEFTAYTGNVLSDRKLMDTLLQNRYDVVLVNIVADVIISLAPVLPQLMDENSILICSGILDTRVCDVCNALKQSNLRVIETYSKEDWRCLCVVK